MSQLTFTFYRASLSELAIALIADKAELGDAGTTDVSQGLVDHQIAGGSIRLELQFRFDRHGQRLGKIAAQRQGIDRIAVPANHALSGFDWWALGN